MQRVAIDEGEHKTERGNMTVVTQYPSSLYSSEACVYHHHNNSLTKECCDKINAFMKMVEILQDWYSN